MEEASSRGRGLAHHLFSKSVGSTHRSKHSSATTSSINMSDAGDHHVEQERRSGGFRSHFDSALEKLRIHESSGDVGDMVLGSSDYGDELEEENDGRKGLSKMISRRFRSRRRKKELEEGERGRSVLRKGTLENDSDISTIYDERNPTPSFGQGDGSSVLTYESEVDDLPPPALLARPSYQTYLTLPLKQALPPVSDAESVPQLDGLLSKASTFPLSSNAVATTETSAVSPAGELQAPIDDNSRRSPSPVGRLAAVLKPRSITSPNSSPERSKGGRGGVFKKDKDGGGASRRGSVASKIGNIFPDRPSTSPATSSAEEPRTAKPHPDLIAIPQTPPNVEKLAPTLIHTPPTPTDSFAPQFPSPPQKDPPKTTAPVEKNSNIVTSLGGNMISHRRMRSGSVTLGPSKLSNIISAPLTPTPENGASSPQTGFFSTAWSAAQSAASTLTNSITNTNTSNSQGRSRSGTHESTVDGDDVEVEILSEKVVPAGEAAEEKELAVKTLGMGDLSLSQFGISDTMSGTSTPTTSKFPDSEDNRGRSGTTESLPARIGTNNMTGEGMENSALAHGEDHSSNALREAPNLPVTGNQTPPNGSVFEGKAGIHRSGSVRSALGGGRRKRGSSAATGHNSLGAIGAAIAAANSSLAHPVAPSGITPKLTGFAVASKKRNRDFHQLFRSVPDDDYLIEDYSCALQKEILAHGRLYVSEGHLCFSSNILGWVNTLVMSFDEIVSVEKRSTALVFRNGLMISTLHAKHIFASFTSRDMTYDLIVGIWKLGHPSLRSSLNGVRLDETGGDKTEKDDGVMSQDASNSEDESEDGDDVYDEDDDGMSFTQAGEGSIVGSENGDTVLSRKASATVVNGLGGDNREDSTSADGKDYLGPVTHPPTDCTDKDSHYDKILVDETVAAPLGKIYGLMFGPNSSTWMSKWMTNDQKCLELVMEDRKGLTDENKSRVYQYIKPLNAAIGPKQTKCITTETLDFLDLERSVSVTMSTQTPDVPSGGIFLTKTRYCLSWGEGGGTRMQVNCTIEWSGKSWLRGPIEKGASDGQIQYTRDLIAGLKAAISAKPKGPSVAVVVKGGKKKGKKNEKSIKIPLGPNGVTDVQVSVKSPKKSDWGMLEPLHEILKAIGDIIGPLIGGNLLYGLLIGLLIASWFWYSGGNRSSSVVRNIKTPRDAGDLMGVAFLASPQRIAAYEEIWRREESELWEWLEDRVGMERLMMTTKEAQKRDTNRVDPRVFDKEGSNDITFGGASERDIEDAIRVTEDKLNALKSAVEKRKDEKRNTAATTAAGTKKTGGKKEL